MIYLIIYSIGCILAYLIAARINDNNKYAVTKLPLIILFFSWASVFILIVMSLPDPTLNWRKRKK